MTRMLSISGRKLFKSENGREGAVVEASANDSGRGSTAPTDSLAKMWARMSAHASAAKSLAGDRVHNPPSSPTPHSGSHDLSHSPIGHSLHPRVRSPVPWTHSPMPRRRSPSPTPMHHRDSPAPHGHSPSPRKHICPHPIPPKRAAPAVPDTTAVFSSPHHPRSPTPSCHPRSPTPSHRPRSPTPACHPCFPTPPRHPRSPTRPCQPRSPTPPHRPRSPTPPRRTSPRKKGTALPFSPELKATGKKTTITTKAAGKRAQKRIVESDNEQPAQLTQHPKWQKRNGELLDNSTDEDEDDNDTLQARPDHLRLNEPQNQTAEGDLVDIVDGPTVQAHVELAARSMPV
ncbi:hypothetical protein P692DRAFT_20879595 [Suillus brevipes Sb2]|nr:hypothetical protein P692DRAFT_20879595 [Suillus brevipes Sb2]